MPIKLHIRCLYTDERTLSGLDRVLSTLLQSRLADLDKHTD